MFGFLCVWSRVASQMMESLRRQNATEPSTIAIDQSTFALRATVDTTLRVCVIRWLATRSSPKASEGW
jgi:hypothetical protein